MVAPAPVFVFRRNEPTVGCGYPRFSSYLFSLLFNGYSLSPPANAPSRLFYQSSSCPHIINTRTTPQGLCLFGQHTSNTPCNYSVTTNVTCPHLTLEAVRILRALLGPPSCRFLPCASFQHPLFPPFPQRGFRSSHVLCDYRLRR